MRRLAGLIRICLVLAGLAGLAMTAAALLGDLVLAQRPSQDFGPTAMRILLAGHLLVAAALALLLVFRGQTPLRSVLAASAATIAGLLIADAVVLRYPLLENQAVFSLGRLEIGITFAALSLAVVGLAALPGLSLPWGRAIRRARLEFADLRQAPHRWVARCLGDLGRGMRTAAVGSVLPVISILFAFAVLEVGLRLVDGEPVFSADNYLFRRLDLLTAQQSNEYHPLLGWNLRPNQTANGQVPYGFTTTGEYGVRMNDSRLAPVPRNAVLAVGDSFTAGSEVGDSESWPAYLEQALGKPVVNAAAGGWGADQIVLRAEEMLDLIAPRMIVVSFLVDDILRNEYSVYGGGAKPYFLVEGGELVHMNNPVPRLSLSDEAFAGWRRVLGYVYAVDWAMRRIDPAIWYQGHAIYQTVPTDVVAVSCLLMKRLKERSDAAGVRLLFVLQYGMGNVRHWDAPPDFAVATLGCIREAGIDTLDTWRTFRKIFEAEGEAGLKRLAVMHDAGRVYGHMSPAGNALVADLILERIKNGN